MSDEVLEEFKEQVTEFLAELSFLESVYGFYVASAFYQGTNHLVLLDKENNVIGPLTTVREERKKHDETAN